MADQTVKISNLPDSGSAARVAFELMGMVRGYPAKSEYTEKKAILDLYAECLQATNGHRDFS